MEYRLDKYNNKISVLGYGCMRFTQRAGKIDIKKTEREIMLAYKAGVIIMILHIFILEVNLL